MTPSQGATKSGKIRITGLGGSIKPGSFGLKALQVTLAAAAAAGAETELLGVHDLQLPMFDPAKTEADYPASVKDFLDAVRRSDGMVWCSPAYHGTVSGAVKNALDFLEFLAKDAPAYLTDKPIGLVSMGGGAQASVNTVNAMSHAAQSLRAIVLPLQAPIVTTGHSFDASGRFSDPKMHDRLELLGRALVDFAGRLRK